MNFVAPFLSGGQAFVFFDKFEQGGLVPFDALI